MPIPSVTLVTLSRTPLMTFETQSLRSQALYLFVKRVNLLMMPRGLGLLRVCLTQFVESFLNGELRSFGHSKFSSLAKNGAFELKRGLKRAASFA